MKISQAVSKLTSVNESEEEVSREVLFAWLKKLGKHEPPWWHSYYGRHSPEVIQEAVHKFFEGKKIWLAANDYFYFYCRKSGNSAIAEIVFLDYPPFDKPLLINTVKGRTEIEKLIDDVIIPKGKNITMFIKSMKEINKLLSTRVTFHSPDNK